MKDKVLMDGSKAVSSIFYSILRRTFASEKTSSEPRLSTLITDGVAVLVSLGIGSPSINSYAIGYFLWSKFDHISHISQLDHLWSAVQLISYYEKNREKLEPELISAI